MPDTERLRRTFLAFHMILGLALLWGSVHTVLHLGASEVHARIIGSVEAVSAVAFLIPATMRAGAVLLFLTIVGAAILHGARGEWRPDLLVYAAGVLLVGVHGTAPRAATPNVA